MSRPSTDSPLQIAVVGAGISGLSAAQALTDAGHAVVCFDKARGPGGRTSLRRADPFAFDHGAQYFTARDPRFRRHVDAWVDEGVVAPWTGRIDVIDEAGAPLPRHEGERPERYVGVPGMNAMAKRMGRGLHVRVRSLVTSLERDGASWTLGFEGGATATDFDVVLFTAPPAQSERLLRAVSSPDSAVLDAARSVRMHPCWAAMVVFDGRYDVPFDGAFVNAGGLSWVCRNSSKPGRPAGDAWVLHATPEWTDEHLERHPSEVAKDLVEELARVSGVAAPTVLHADSHRWMFSGAVEPRDVGAVFDDAPGLGIAGDWLCGSKVQGAWLSGRALAGHVLGSAACNARERIGE